MTISAVAQATTAGNRSAADQRRRFEEEAIPYMERLFPAALRLTRNHGDAEDLIQETFTKACFAFHQFTPGTNLKAWLYRILVTTFYSAYRKRSRQPDEVLAAEIFDPADAVGELGRAPRSAEAQAMENLGDSAVMRALRELPESFKVAVYLADVHGYRYSEVAELMNTPLGTVMSRIHRGRQMLRAKLTSTGAVVPAPGRSATGSAAQARGVPRSVPARQRRRGAVQVAA